MDMHLNFAIKQALNFSILAMLLYNSSIKLFEAIIVNATL